MKKFYSILSVLAFLVVLLSMNLVFAQSVGIGGSSFTPKSSSLLEVRASNKGILIPRISLTGTNDVTTIPTSNNLPNNSLMIYNTATVAGGNAVSPGYYYRDSINNIWVKFLTANTNAWLTNGNTNSSLMTIGTKDAFDFPIITNSVERMRVTSGGQVCIGTTAISATGTDLEIRNTTTGSNPYPAPTISMRATNQIIIPGHYMAKINFGDDFQTGPQAQIAVVRDAAGTSGDLPTGITFSTIPSGSSSLLERVRISNSGSVGINCIPDPAFCKLDVQATSNTAYIRTKSNTGGSTGLIIDKAASGDLGNVRFFTGGSEYWQVGALGSNAFRIRYIPGTAVDVFTISATSQKFGIGNTPDNINQLYVYQTGTVTDGSAFGTTTSRSAILGYGQDARYNFGVTGYSPASFDHSGGVLGVNGSTSWGALAYRDEFLHVFAGYFYGNAYINGNLGIGVAVPTEKIDVSGNIKASDNIYGSVVGVGTTTPNSKLEVSGSFATAVSLKSGDYTLTANDYTLIFKSALAYTATLPAASGCSGRIYVIVNQGSASLTITSFQNMLDIATTSVASGTSITIQSNGSSWYQIR